MKILLVGEDRQGSLATSCKNALRELGHHVRIYDYFRDSYPFLCSETPLSKKGFPIGQVGFILREYRLRKEGILSANDKLMEKVLEFNPDLILVFKGETIFPQTLRKIKKMCGPRIFNWNSDNPYNRLNSSRYLLESIPLYDCYFIWGKFLIPLLKRSGAQRVEYLPFAYDPHLHHPVSVTEKEEKQYGSDVVFVGTWEKDREEMLENLVDFDLAIWGNSWENLRRNSPLRKFVRSNAKYGETMSKIYRSSRIVLNFIRKQNGDAHNMRTFEVPACGGFMLATRTKEQTEFFREGEEADFFSSPEELRTKIKYYLSNPDLRTAIAQRGLERVENETYLQRMEKVTKVLESLRS